MTYLIAEGTDVALVDLDPIAPQPRSDGIRAARRSYTASGAVYDEVMYLELAWGIVGSATAYQALLAQFGLDAALTAAVTVYARNDMFVWGRYNGLAVRPENGRDLSWDIFPRNVTILIKQLELLIDA